MQPIINQLYDIQNKGRDKIKLKIINPVTEEQKSLAMKRGIRGIPIEEAEIDKSSVRMGYFGIYLQYGDKTSVVSLVDSGGIVGNFEYIFLKDLKNLIQSGTRDSSGIAFLDTEGTLRSIQWQSQYDQDKDNIYVFKTFLEKELGSIKSIDLKSPVPETVESIVIAGSPDLSKEQQIYLDQFLMRGGNLFLMLRSFDFDLTPPNPQLLQLGLASNSGGFIRYDEEKIKRINEFLNRYGLQIQSRIVLEPQLAAPELDIQGQYTVRYANPSWAVYTNETGNISGENEVTRLASQLILPWFSDLDFKQDIQPGVKYNVLIQSTPTAIVRKETSLSLSELQSVGRKIEDEKPGKSLPLMILAQGKFVSGFKEEYENQSIDKGILEQLKNFLTGQIGNTESKIILVGTPYIVSDIFFRNQINVEIFKINLAFILNLLEYLQGDTDLLAVRSKVDPIPILKIQLPRELEKFFSWFHILTIPVAIMIYGFIRLRKRYQKRGI